MNEKDYHDFLNIANEYGLTVEEKIHEVINYYLLTNRKGLSYKQKSLD